VDLSLTIFHSTLYNFSSWKKWTSDYVVQCLTRKVSAIQRFNSISTKAPIRTLAWAYWFKSPASQAVAFLTILTGSSARGFFSSRFTTEIPVYISHIPMRATCSDYFIPLELTTQIMLSDEHNLRSF